MSRHAVPFADTQCLSRLRRGLRGQAAGNFAFLPGHAVAFAPTAGTTRAGGWEFCFLARTHSVFRAYGGDYMGKRAILKGRSCPSYGRIGRFSVIAWKRDRLSLLGRAMVRKEQRSRAERPSGSAVQMCSILVACTWIAGREFQRAVGKADGLCEEAAAFPHESFKMGMAYFY